MTTSNYYYAADRTAILVVDPYNDFMSEGGKLFNAIKETRGRKIRRSGAILTAHAGRPAHRIPSGRPPGPRAARARASEMLARRECGCHRLRVAAASP